MTSSQDGCTDSLECKAQCKLSQSREGRVIWHRAAWKKVWHILYSMKIALWEATLGVIIGPE